MAYKKNEGRYVRMAAFWALFLLVGYGCLGGLVYTVDGIIGTKPWMDQFPILGQFGWAQVVSLTVLATAGLLIYRFLERPKVADLLIDTEGELRKVTWPNASETWTGTAAVAVTVVVMLVFLFLADAMLAAVMERLLDYRSTS